MARHAAPRARSRRRSPLPSLGLLVPGLGRALSHLSSQRPSPGTRIPNPGGRALRTRHRARGLELGRATLRRAEVQVLLGALAVALALALVGSLLPLGAARPAAAAAPSTQSASQLIKLVEQQQTTDQSAAAQRDRAAAMAWLSAMQQMEQLTAADHIKVTLVKIPVAPAPVLNAGFAAPSLPTGPLGRVIPNQVTLNVLAADRLLASLPASMSLLDKASLIKTTDQIGSRDAEWSRANRKVYPNTPRATAVEYLAAFGFNLDQWGCLDRMWWQESNWNPLDGNQSSGAYGIPQSLPANKMAAAGADWQTNPTTQIRWGLAYIAARYGSPCQAWSFWTLHYWY